MTTKRVPQVATLDYTANTTVSKALERTGLITHLDLLLTVNQDYAAGSLQEQALIELIASLAIKDGEGHTWFSVGDGRQLYWKNFIEYQGQVMLDTPQDGDSGAVDYAMLQIHFGKEPLNPFDPSSGIPAKELAQLTLEVTWANAAAVGSGVTINSASIKITPAIILAGPQYDAVRPHILLPSFRWEKHDVASVMGDLGLEKDLPAGTILKYTDLMVVDSSDDRTDSEVTEVGYKKILENTIPFKEAWQTLRGRMRARYGLTADPSGIARINWGEIAGDVALDLRGRLTGYDKLGFTTAVGSGDIWLLHTAYAAR